MTEHHHISSLKSLLGDEFAELAHDEQALLADAWLLAGDAAPVDRSFKEAARRQVGARTRPRETRSWSFPLFGRSWIPSLSLAASIVLIAVVGLFNQPDTFQYAAPVGATASHQLPDGSSFVLSPGSLLIVSGDFGVRDRSTSLTGEAYFDVARADEPFLVLTENARVQVLGTAFNVRSWSDDGMQDTQVFVERGLVRVSGQADALDVRVRPGEATRVSASGLPATPEAAPAERALAWMDGGLAFSDEPVIAVLNEIERRFDIRIDAPAGAETQRISFFKHDISSLAETLADVTDAAGLRYRSTANGYVVFAP